MKLRILATATLLTTTSLAVPAIAFHIQIVDCQTSSATSS